MSRKRYSPEKIIGMLREAEGLLAQGMTVGQISRQLSIPAQTYYRRRKQYGGLKISQVRRMKDIDGFRRCCVIAVGRFITSASSASGVRWDFR
ncbi:hypothetical protein D1BOALGB6SA_8051 [Olavius sp. associated proteobacterium Delta 1]|nr:hypothetical protein D1BOALGB6SA_8051 [Olavius sp. associated proteobacterium Delta 1]